MITVYGIETLLVNTQNYSIFRRNVMITVYGIETPHS